LDFFYLKRFAHAQKDFEWGRGGLFMLAHFLVQNAARQVKGFVILFAHTLTLSIEKSLSLKERRAKIRPRIKQRLLAAEHLAFVEGARLRDELKCVHDTDLDPQVVPGRRGVFCQAREEF
jgi:hypothetical protein